MRFLKSRQNFGRVCFRKGTGDGGNLQDRRDIVRVPVAFVTSGSMMRPPPPPRARLGTQGGETGHVGAHKLVARGAPSRDCGRDTGALGPSQGDRVPPGLPRPLMRRWGCEEVHFCLFCT